MNRSVAANTLDGRVPLKDLLRYAHAISKAKPGDPNKEIERKAQETGERIRSCSVRGFYEAFLLDRVSDFDELSREQEKLDEYIGAMFGEKTAPDLTMGGLASMIAEKMGQEDLSDEDRWALYELCFFLTAQMARLDGAFFSEMHQSTRLGTPDEKEPRSLYFRVRKHRKKVKAGANGPRIKVRMDDLLRSAGQGDHVLSEHTRLKLPELKAGPVLDCLLTAKYGLDLDDQKDSLELFNRSSRFLEMFSMYTGQEWSGSNSIAELATMMTWVFWLKVKDANGEGIGRPQVLQAYELCYEFINVLASAEHDEGHVSLMVREGLGSRYDLDESIRVNLSAMMDAAD